MWSRARGRASVGARVLPVPTLGLGWREKRLLVGLGSGESSQGRPRLTLLGPRLTPLVTRMWHLSSGHGLRRSNPPVRVVALARSPQQHL